MPVLANQQGDARLRDRQELARVLTRVGAGDRAAFEEVYRLTAAKLLGTCLRILVVRGEAEEALQEAYLSVWRRAASFDPERGSPMTWLITVARNAAVDRLRARGKVQTAPIELAAEVADPGDDATTILSDKDDAARLARCLEGLAVQDRGFIRTAFFEGSSYPELAARVAMPLATVKSRIRRALLALRVCLE